MKKIIMSFALLGLVFSVAAKPPVEMCEKAKYPTAESIFEITEKVADWQLEHFEYQVKYRAPRKSKKTGELVYGTNVYHDLLWQHGAFYAGLYRFSTIADDSKYLSWLKQVGYNNDWQLHTRMFHADDHTVGQMYLYLAEYYGNPKFYASTQERFDAILASKESNDYLWDWSDALFMAPPVWSRLAKLTKESKYLEFMDKQYHMTYDELWDSEKQLFFRDKSFIEQRESNGEKLFWSRGNGWVFGGLAYTIPELPKNWEGREFYIQLFKEMAEGVKNAQREDGSWAAGLLSDRKAYGMIETSGSSFFTMALAWGINNGILDRKEYEPTLLKAWAAICGAVNHEGMLGYVQGVGASPNISLAETTEVYGSGAFLAAGTEMYHYANKFFK